MDILLCISPWNEKSLVTFYTWLRRIEDFFISDYLIEKKGFKFSLIINKFQYNYSQRNHKELLENIENLVVFDSEILGKLGDEYSFQHKWFSGDYNSYSLNLCANYIKLNLPKDYKPVLIINFFHSAPYVEKLYPTVCNLNFIHGGFNRNPFPETWWFDTGFIWGSSLINFSKENLYNEISDDEKNRLNSFRESYKKLLNNVNPFKKQLSEYKKQFDKLLLLPLQLSDRPSFDCVCEFEDQIEYLHYVFKHVPSNVGVVVTEHPRWPIITARLDRYLRDIYPNYIYTTEFLEYSNSSQYLLSDVDYCVTVSSSVGFQTLIWEKPLIVLGNSNLSVLSDGCLENILNLEYYINKDKMFYFLLTHCWITTDYMNNPCWLYDYLNRMLMTKDTRSLPVIDSDEKYMQHLIDVAEEIRIEQKDLYKVIDTIEHHMVFDSLKTPFLMKVKRKFNSFFRLR